MEQEFITYPDHMTTLLFYEVSVARRYFLDFVHVVNGLYLPLHLNVLIPLRCT